MRIAVTYDNGEVFGHFGHTKQFKLYEIEGTKIHASAVIDAQGAGHDALVGMLSELHADVLICGGLGDGALMALREAGIAVCSGASGNADEVVMSFLEGEEFASEANCDHHSRENQEEQSGCGCGCQDDQSEGGCGGCGGGCGGCGGGCGGPLFEGKNVGKSCKVHYRGTFNDGTQFDASYDRGEPIEFVCGMGMMILGFDKAVADMEVGEKKEIHLLPEEAYGPADPNAIFPVELANLPGAETLNVGDRVALMNPMGREFPVTVVAKDETTITFDANHEMAGKELNFLIELVEVTE